MFFSRLNNMDSIMGLYCSFSIFLFSAISLVVPSGFSYGALLLLLGSIVLFRKGLSPSLQKDDWRFIVLLLAVFIITVMSNVFHGLSFREYDNASRYLLAIPVYLLLISFPPSQYSFWAGLSISVCGAGLIAVYQRYFNISLFGDGRAGGFMHPIQFGDISILLAGLLVCGFMWVSNRRYQFLFIILPLLGVIASFLSSSRGGWLAIPIIISIFYFASDLSTKQKIIIYLTFFSILVVVALACTKTSDANFLTERLIETKSELNSYAEGAGEYNSLTSRLMLWDNALAAFKVHPYLGWGDINKIKIAFPSEWESIHFHEILNHYHNEFINALAIRGIVGAFMLAMLYLIPLYYFVSLMRTKRSDVRPFAAAGVVLILSVIVFGLTQCFIEHNSGTMAFLFYMVIVKAYCRNIVNRIYA